MKFKRLAKLVLCKFVRVSLIEENGNIRSVYKSETGLTEKIVEQYGEYKVDMVDADTFTPPFQNLRQGIFLILLRSKKDED